MTEPQTATLTLLLAVVAFGAGLIQYHRAQVWKRREFVASEFEKLLASAPARNALKMLDYTLRWIDLHPEASDPNQRFVRVSRGYLAAMLIPHDVDNRPNYGIQGAAIRDCFDELLTRLDNLHAMADAGLINKNELKPYLKYWTRRLADPHSTGEGLEAHFHRNLWLFIDTYKYKGVQKLCARFGSKIKPKDGDLDALKAECAAGLWKAHVKEIKDKMKGARYVKDGQVPQPVSQ